MKEILRVILSCVSIIVVGCLTLSWKARSMLGRLKPIPFGLVYIE